MLALRLGTPLVRPSDEISLRFLLEKLSQLLSLLTSLVPRASPLSKWRRRYPWPRLLKWLQKFVRTSSRKHDEMTSFRLNNGFRLQKTNREAKRWKQPPKKPFHHVSRDKILHDSWSISAALARGFSDRHFERGEGPGDEVALLIWLFLLGWPGL